jgi:hypothetical protein
VKFESRDYITVCERLRIVNNDGVDIDTRDVFIYDTRIIDISK